MENKKRCFKGFALLEVVIMIAVLGVLAGLAIPTYQGTMEQARRNEADVNLQIVRTGEKIYALNNADNYWDPADPPSIATVNSTLNIDISTQFYDLTHINANNSDNPKTLSIRFTRNTTNGGNGTSTRTIDQNGTIT